MSPAGWLNNQLTQSTEDINDWPEWMKDSTTENRCEVLDDTDK